MTAAIIANPTMAIPAPIPAFAPVDSPPLSGVVVGVAVAVSVPVFVAVGVDRIELGAAVEVVSDEELDVIRSSARHRKLTP